MGVVARIFEPEERKKICGSRGELEVTRQAIDFGPREALTLIAFVSLSLAIINLFPFLPLDGGHIFWSLVEKVRGRPVPFSVMERAGRGRIPAGDGAVRDRALERHRQADRGGVQHSLGARIRDRL